MSANPDLAIEEDAEGIVLRVRVQPRASREAVRLGGDGCLHVAVTAPPVDNAANAATCAYLAKVLGAAKRDVIIAAGAHSRNKTVRVTHMHAAAAKERLETYQGKGLNKKV